MIFMIFLQWQPPPVACMDRWPMPAYFLTKIEKYVGKVTFVLLFLFCIEGSNL